MGSDDVVPTRKRPNLGLIIIIILIVIAVIIIIILWCSTRTGRNNLPAPTNLSATVTDNKVTLNWDIVPGATRYRVYISQSSSFDCNSASAKQDVTSPPATVSNLENGTYYFAVASVKACNGFETVGVLSAPVSATVPQCSGAPPAPSQLVVSPGHNSGTVDLQWSAVDNAANYNIYRSEGLNVSPSSYQQKATVAGCDFRATFVGLSCGTTQSFVVTAVNACGTEGPATPIASIVVPCNIADSEQNNGVEGSQNGKNMRKQAIKEEEKYVTITDVVGDGNKISLSWQPHKSATEYTVYLKEGKELDTGIDEYDYKQVLSSTITQYTFHNLTPGKVYAVGVSMLKGDEESGLAFYPIELTA